MSKLVSSLQKAVVKSRRKAISRYVFDKFKGEVRYGPFKGLFLSGNANTSKGNLGAKVCGLYEQTLLNWLSNNGPYKDVVNFGAADGYFSIGLLISGTAERSICFESTEMGRKAIEENARMNGVSDSIIIRGVVDENVGSEIAACDVNLKEALILCDIEGSEFDVLTSKVLCDLEGITLVVELHDRLMPENLSLRQDLIARLPEKAKHEILKSTPANWQGIPEIEAMTDYDRALIAIDGRKILGEWLLVTYPD